MTDRYDPAHFRRIPTPGPVLRDSGAVLQLLEAVRDGQLHYWTFGLQHDHLCSLVVHAPDDPPSYMASSDKGDRPYAALAAAHLLEITTFVPVRLPTHEQRDEAFGLLRHAVAIGALAEWELGLRGGFICSRYRLPGPDGKTDWLASGSKSDRDWTSLVRAHASRLPKLLGIVGVPSPPPPAAAPAPTGPQPGSIDAW